MNFKRHVSEICIKTSRQVNALKKLSPYLKENNRLSLYRSFINSNFNNCPLIWMFCGKTNWMKVEKLQERARRFVYHDFQSTYDELLTKGSFLSISALRTKFLSIEMYKCYNGLLQPT